MTRSFVPLHYYFNINITMTSTDSCFSANIVQALCSATTIRQACSMLRSIPVHDGVVMSEALEATLCGDRVPCVIEVQEWIDSARRAQPSLWKSPPVLKAVANLLTQLQSDSD